MSASNYSPTFPSALKSEIIYAKTNLFQTLQQIAKKTELLKTKILRTAKKKSMLVNIIWTKVEGVVSYSFQYLVGN